MAALAALKTAKPNLMDGAQRSQTCEPMNKNRIEGRYGTTSWHNTAKSSGLPVEVNAAVVQGSIAFLPGEWERSGHGGSDCLTNKPSNLPGAIRAGVSRAIVVGEMRSHGPSPWSDRNRRMRTRMSGGLGGVTGAIPSPRPDSAYFLRLRIAAVKATLPSSKAGAEGSGTAAKLKL